MPKFKVTATMDVGYTAIIEADNQEEAWSIARGEGLAEADWEKTDNGHCWTLEDIWELASISPSANFVECEQGQMGEGKNDYIFDPTIDKIEFPYEPLNEKIVEYAKTNDPAVPVQKHKPNPPRNPFSSETQSIKGHKSRK